MQPAIIVWIVAIVYLFWTYLKNKYPGKNFFITSRKIRGLITVGIAIFGLVTVYSTHASKWFYLFFGGIIILGIIEIVKQLKE